MAIALNALAPTEDGAPMTPKTFDELQAEFLETDKKFKAARTLGEQMAMLREMERIVREMEDLIQNEESAKPV